MSSTLPRLPRRVALAACLLFALAAAAALPLAASSHREAPFVTEHPKVDATDLYAFRSYEPGREGFVTLIANYFPLQDAYGGPNYFDLDPDAEYLVHVDNDGDGLADVSFAFAFDSVLKGLALAIGPDGEEVAVALKNIGELGLVFPPADDVVDAEPRVAMGLLCHLGLGLCEPEDAPSGLLPFTDGVLVDATRFGGTFPYLRDAVPGSPNSLNGVGEK